MKQYGLGQRGIEFWEGQGWELGRMWWWTEKKLDEGSRSDENFKLEWGLSTKRKEQEEVCHGIQVVKYIVFP